MIKMTKAEFWLPLEKQYPVQIADFRAWIDEFKRRENWSRFFRYEHAVDGTELHAPKFHDLSNAMQLGIFIQYTVEHGGRQFVDQYLIENKLSMEAWVNRIRTWFEDEQTLETKAINNQLHLQ